MKVDITRSAKPPEQSAEFKELVANNIWHDGGLLTGFVNSLRALVGGPHKRWSWLHCGKPCKYLTIRIDMRDGGFVVLDNDKNRISAEEIGWQHGKEES